MTLGRRERLLHYWFDLPLVSKGVIVISIPLACILFFVAAIVVFQWERGRLDDWISRAFNAGATIQRVITSLSDAESGTRGYLLTNDSRYLERLHQAEINLPKNLARIETYVGDMPRQREHLARVGGLARERLTTLRSLAASSGREDVPARLENTRALTEAIEKEFAEMRQEESRLWVDRIAAERRLRERLSMFMYGSAAVTLGAGSLAMGLFLTGVAGRAQALRVNADRVVRGSTLVEVGGSDEIGRAGEALARAGQILAERERELRALNEALEDRVKERSAALEREMAERRQSEEQLRQAQKMEAIGRLAGGIAHDFNNVLTVVIGFGNSLTERVADNPEAMEDLNEILQAADHAVVLTRQLLTFSRQQVLQPRVVDLNDVVARSEKLLRRVLGEDIELRTIRPPMGERVLMDEGQLEQVIMNLAVNARDAMPKGGRLVIQTDVVEFDEAYSHGHLNTAPGRYVMLACHDTGHGMTAEVQARIFEPFFTTKAPTKGTGLGLATVYGIVKQGGGSIHVYSEPDAGSVFKLYFPAVAAGSGTIAKAAPVEAVPVRPATILLVEDDPGVRRMVKQVLERDSHTVLAAEDGDDALRVAAEHSGPIELLLTDVIMPRTNGIDLARALTAAHHGMKVLYMSGYANDLLSGKPVLDAGAAFLEKPFTASVLIRKIGDVLASGPPGAGETRHDTTTSSATARS